MWMRKFKKEDIFTLIGVVVLSLILYFLHQIIGDKMLEWIWLLNGLLLTLLFAYIYTRIGIIVIQSLFKLSAELSLVIFIAYTYYSVPDALRSSQSDQALRSLLTFGFLFIAYEFVRRLYKALTQKYLAVKNELKQGEKIVFVSFSLLAVILFIWQIYLVLQPILLDLYVLKA